MGIARDWLQPTETHDVTETQYANHLLEDWGKWQRSDGLCLKPTAAGQVLRINAIMHRTWDLNMTDDQFTVVDRIIARLPDRLRDIVFAEYAEFGTQPGKWQRIGLNRLAYRQRLHAAQWAVFTSLGELVDKWRQKVVNPVHT